MVTSREDIRKYIEADLKYYERPRNIIYLIKDIVFQNESYYISKYIRILRHLEYYKNNMGNGLNKVLYLYYFTRWKRICHKTGLDIHPNCCGPGLYLFHTISTKTGMTPETRIGSRVILRPGVVLGYQGDSMRDSKKSPIVEDEVEFSWGAKVFGKIHIGRGALINTNSTVLSNVPPYAIVAGNPGKVIGFTKTPKEIVEYEKMVYPEGERLPIEELERNYEKYFISRYSDIKKYVKV